MARGLEGAGGPCTGSPHPPTELPRALTSTLHWQLEPVTGEEGLCTPSLARSHTA